jgi:hypothetical protein
LGKYKIGYRKSATRKRKNYERVNAMPLKMKPIFSALKPYYYSPLKP